MKYLSLFSGIGGFELGIGEHNECIGFSEIDKYAIQIYQKHFPTHKAYGDITKINTDELPNFDLICGGFPCQSFSIAGKRGGFEDTRGTLFFEIARIVRAKRPRYIFLENVKGLLSHDKGNTFATIISTIDELGYDVQWQVLNSKNFGVPQNRERVFIVGHLRGTTRPQVFPIGEDDQIYSQSREVEEEVHDVTQTITTQSGSNATGSYIANTLTARQFASWNGNYIAPNGKEIDLTEVPNQPFQLLETRTEKGKKSRKEIRQNEGRDSTLRGKDDKKYIPKKDNTANALTTGSGVIEKWLFEPKVITHYGHKNQEAKESEISPTLKAQSHGHEPMVKESTGNKGQKFPYMARIRKLTPVECERLQGFPDNWTAGVSDSQRYKCLGNAVTVNVIKAIMSNLCPSS